MDRVELESVLDAVRVACRRNHRGLSSVAGVVRERLVREHGSRLPGGGSSVPSVGSLRAFVAFGGVVCPSLVGMRVVFEGERPDAVVVSGLDAEEVLWAWARMDRVPSSFSVEMCGGERLLGVVRRRGPSWLVEEARRRNPVAVGGASL